MSDRFVLELRAAAQAGVPIVCVVTHEERRALGLVGEAFRGARVLEWTATRGWSDDATVPSALAAIERAGHAGETGAARVMLDVHPWLSDARVVRALRDLAAARRDLPLVLIMPAAALPPELDRDARVLALPLPDASAIARAFQGEELDPGWPREAFVRAALGLTLDEATRAFRIARSIGDPGAALQRVIAEKRGALRRSACLELLDAEITLDDVGGLEVIKSWLGARVLAFDAGARDFGLAEPRGMLVCGVQGCGKSLVSKATARVLGLPLVRLDFAEVFAAASPEHAIHEAVRAVEAVAPVVLWVDEISRELDHWSGAEIEQMVSGALFRAYAEKHDLTEDDLRSAARELVPLATLYEEKIQALRQWGQARARRASTDRRTLDLFGD